MGPFPCRLCHAKSDTTRSVHRNQILLLLVCLSALTLSISQSAEEFSEELLLRPLPDGKVVAHFHFTHELPPSSSYGHHHRLFPKAIYQLVQKFQIREMELSFTQGRWNYNMWGGVDPLTRLHAKPSGVELWAVFAVLEDQLDATWGNLTHALSGLFCASLNFLDSPAMVADPVRTFMPDHSNQDVQLNVNSDHVSNGKWKLYGGKAERLRQVRYGALAREAVCTENLTPWLKFLPCRDKAGLSTLLDRPLIYKTWYHSLRLYVRSYEFEEPKDGEYKGTLLQQTLSLVIQPSKDAHTGPQGQPSWSLHSLFGRDLSGKCLLAKQSAVYMEFDSALIEKLEDSGMAMAWKGRRDTCIAGDAHHATEPFGCSKGASGYLVSLLPSEFKENSIFKVQGVPSNFSLIVGDNGKLTSALLLKFSVPEHVKTHSFHLGLTWKEPFTWRPVRGPFRATRFLVGSGNARGAIAIVLKSNQLQTGGSTDLPVQVSPTGGFVASELVTVTVFQIVPWYIRLYFHTSKVAIDGRPVGFWEVVRWMRVVPSEDRTSSGVMEIELLVPSNVSEVTLITEFDKGFLHIDEHPPDANRGFDLPSALLSFPSQNCQAHYHQVTGNVNTDPSQESGLLRELQRKKVVQVYTEVLLVPLATPDFSMPYNVITLTCTVLALYFGSLLNVLRRRIGEEERLANKPEGPSQSMLERLITRLLGRNRGASAANIAKVIKVALVVALAVAVNHYLSNR